MPSTTTCCVPCWPRPTPMKSYPSKTPGPHPSPSCVPPLQSDFYSFRLTATSVAVFFAYLFIWKPVWKFFGKSAWEIGQASQRKLPGCCRKAIAGSECAGGLGCRVMFIANDGGSGLATMVTRQAFQGRPQIGVADLPGGFEQGLSCDN